MPHPIIASYTEYRCPITGVLEAEVAYDADGQECLRVEYDVNVHQGVRWMNVRDDLLDGQDLALEQMYREVVGVEYAPREHNRKLGDPREEF